MFADDWVFAAAWTHYLVFDMVVGAWIARDAVRLGIPWPLRTLALVLTFLLGPVGFLVHLVTRFILRRALAVERTAELPGEFAAAADWIRAMPTPRFVIVGNHDVPYYSLTARLFHPWRAFEAATGYPAHDGEFVSDSVMVRGVVTARGWQARPNWSKGVIDLDQTRRAAEALRRAPVGALRILACHHPLVEMIGAPMTGEVKRGDAAAVIFAEAGVDLITTGHVHVPFALPIDLSDRCSYAIGCGTLSHRERGAPPTTRT
jgi:3',5'-cyclic AMP phosphodiesterase CpdA